MWHPCPTANSHLPLLLLIDRTDSQMDGWIPDYYRDPAPHTMQAESTKKNSLGVALSWMMVQCQF